MSQRRTPLSRMGPWFSATKNDPTKVRAQLASLTTPQVGSCQCTRSTSTRATWRYGHSFQQGTRCGQPYGSLQRIWCGALNGTCGNTSATAQMLILPMTTWATISFLESTLTENGNIAG